MYMNLRRAFLILRLQLLQIPRKSTSSTTAICRERWTWSHQVGFLLSYKLISRQWRQERNLQIQRREEISQKKKQEIMEQAKQAIDDFYDNYNNQKEKSIAQTRYFPFPSSIWGQPGGKKPIILRPEMKVLVEPHGNGLPSMWIFLKRALRVQDQLDIVNFCFPWKMIPMLLVQKHKEI